jgi:hypothetical protein
MRWVGVDEAGYGPNLGPLVMTAVIAGGPGERPPDIWNDLGPRVSRAGGPAVALWVDDSKRIYRARHGADRLEAACLAVVDAAGRPRPATLSALLSALDAGTRAEAELDLWDDGVDPAVPREASRPLVEWTRVARPLEGASWRIVGVRSVVVGPSQFNRTLSRSDSKAGVHFAAFARLMRWVWDSTPPGETTVVRGDKHGGRHFYLGPLSAAFPDLWIDRAEEGPDLSRYVLRREDRRLELSLVPRADADDGLVALASLVSKAVREYWMDVFNAHWTARVPGLRPTAGYPADASRFRDAVGPLCRARGIAPESWWRSK